MKRDVSSEDDSGVHAHLHSEEIIELDRRAVMMGMNGTESVTYT